jgi:hypothetical protein
MRSSGGGAGRPVSTQVSADVMDRPRRSPLCSRFERQGRIILIVAPAAFGGDACTEDEVADKPGWLTARAEGFSLSLPASFVVFTDQQRLLDELDRLGQQQSASFIAAADGNPFSFVLFATEPQHETGWATTVLVLRAPTLGLSLREFARSLGAAFEQGPRTLVRQTERNVGVDDIRAVQMDIENEMPGVAEVSLGRYFVFRNKSDTLLVMYDFPASEATRMKRVWSRSIASVALA